MNVRSLAARAAAISTFALVAACGELALPDLPSFSLGGSAPQSLALLDGSVMVIGPDGFCVDPRSSDARTGFAAIAACASFDRSSEIPNDLAFITLQVGQSGSALASDLTDLRSVLEDSDALGGISDAAFSTDTDLNAVIVTYRSAPPSDGAQARAFFDLSDRSATLTVTQLEQAPLSLSDARALLVEALQRLRSANATLSSDAA